MKKLLMKIGGIALLGVLMIYNIEVSKDADNSISLASVMNTAHAQGEFDPIAACNSWCYPAGYVCWLKLSTGADLYCYGWDEPF